MIANSVTAIVFNQEKKSVLVVKRRDVPIWTLPGGGIDAGESPEIAAVREVFEETGLVVKVERQIAFYTPVNRLSKPTALFECVQISGQLTTSDETREVGFFPLEKLPKPFFFIHLDWIHDAQLQLPTLIVKPLTKVTYFQFFLYFMKHPIQVIRFLLSRLSLPINSK